MSDDGSVTRWFGPLRAGDHEAAQRLWQHFASRLVGLARARLRAAPRRAADEEDAVLSAFDSFCRGAEQGHSTGEAPGRRAPWRERAVFQAGAAFGRERSASPGITQTIPYRT